VFPGDGIRGHLVSPKKAKTKVIEATGISFSLHDLRRTFTTIAESLDIPAYALKRMLNHSDGSDVTAGYIVASVERLREPMQKVADYLMRAMKIKPTKIYSFEDNPNVASTAVDPR
jgi:integrase